MGLREYQERAVEETLAAVDEGARPCLMLPPRTSGWIPTILR